MVNLLHSPKEALSLRANFLWTFVGNVVYAACQWGMLIIIAKLGDPEMVGQFALGLAVTAPIVLFANLQLRSVQATDSRHEYHFGEYLALRIVCLVLALLIIAGIALLTGYQLDAALAIVLLGVAKCCEALSDIFHGLLQQHERMDRIAISLCMKGLLSLVTLSLALILTHTLAWGIFGMAIVWAAMIIYDYRNGIVILRGNSQHYATGLLRHESLRMITRLVVLALPLGFVTLLISLNTNIPRYFIEHWLGARALGIFAAAAYVLVAGTTVVSALAQAASPRLARHFAAGDRQTFAQLLLKLSLVAVALATVGILAVFLFGAQLLSLLYGSDYADQNNVFLILMVAAGFSFQTWFLNAAMVAARCIREQVPLFILVIVTTLVASALLVPTHGLQGAAFVVLISTVLQVCGSIVILGRIFRHSTFMTSSEAA